MRIVADTNVIVSGLLWHGSSRQFLNTARLGKIQLFTSVPLLIELEDVLSREKFRTRLSMAKLNPRDLVYGYASLAAIINPPAFAPVVVRDPDDNAVIACAVSAGAKIIVSGDLDFLDLKKYDDIEIIRIAEFMSRIATSPGE